MSQHQQGEGAGAAVAAVAVLLLIFLLLAVGVGGIWLLRSQGLATIAERERMMAMVERDRAEQARRAAEVAEAAAREAAAARIDPPAVAEDDPLAGLSWLAGSWASEQGDMEEHWLSSRGGLMLGLNRSVNAAGKTSFEFLRIESGDDGIVYFASPGGRTATPFRLKDLSAERVVFENPAHDFPQRILYQLLDADTLQARIEGEVGGEARSAEWAWRRGQRAF